MRPDPVQGERMDVNLVGVDKGSVWTGFEWVNPERYGQLRAGPMPCLPPMQPLPGETAAPWHQEPKPTPCGNPKCVTCAGPPEYTEEQVRIMNADMEFGHRLADAQQDEAVILELLKYVIGEDPTRGGLLETPARAVKAWREWTSGYSKDPAAILKVFEDGAEGCDEMVVVHNIPVYSHCEHHMAPIFGSATVAYIPNGKIVGLSKLPRLVDIFARRLQVQERLTNQVAEAIMEHLKPRGCGVVVKARHMCMESRGIKQAGGYTTTSALRGVFREDAAVRGEFLALTRDGI